jgi:mono/diheme cytochrome c family protein
VPSGGRATFQPSEHTYREIMDGNRNDVGARMYMGSCAACHRLDA